ncbi:MAG: rhodanese-like domain-containing protein [Methylacidiphilales bacterium]|nr:rhodanese-like domain-containing protein [Candidatus Methylacidiphilales bacterium]
MTKQNTYTISVTELQKLLQTNKQIVLLDVRHAWEREECCIPNDTHIPLAELESKSASMLKDIPIIVYCHHGMRSKQAVAVLLDLGFQQVSSLDGGIHEWSNKIDPSIGQY